MDQARISLMQHYDTIQKEYDITNVNTAPPHQLLYDLYHAIEEYQRWEPELQAKQHTDTPGKRRKTTNTNTVEDVEMKFDDEDELKDFPNLMIAERYSSEDIKTLPLSEVETCLREYYAFTDTKPGDDYFDVESETTLRQHMFEAVVALLTHYNIGIKTTTTDEEIKTMDTCPRWLCSGDTCSKIMAKKGTGMFFHDPDKKLTVRKQGNYFVDDTATGVTLNTLRADQRDIFDQLNFIEQLHSDILFSLGHKLAIDKCSFYAADYIRGNLKHAHKLILELPGTIHIRETHTSNPINVKRLQPFQAHKTLGCHLALNYNQGKQFRELHKKLEQWNCKVKSSFLTASEKNK